MRGRQFSGSSVSGIRPSQYFSNAEIECVTTAQGSIIPYRVLVSMDIKTREHEEVDKKNFPGRVQAAALNAKKATQAFEAATKRSKDAQANFVKTQAGLEEAQTALDQGHKATKQAQIEVNAAAAEEGPVAAAQKAAQDGLMSSICAMVTDQDILSTLQPILQGLALHELAILNCKWNWKIDWKTRAGLESATA